MLEHLNVGSSIPYAVRTDKGQTRSFRRSMAATVAAQPAQGETLNPLPPKGFSAIQVGAGDVRTTSDRTTPLSRNGFGSPRVVDL
jgi:hypothetical protein